MSDAQKIIKAIEFRKDELETALKSLMKNEAPDGLIFECSDRIDELESLLDHINKEIIK